MDSQALLGFFFMKKIKLYNPNDFLRRSGRVAPADPARSSFQKDYARLLHAPSFRRLQGKTQLFPGSDSDFFRNRLTHSLEVAQIASGIADVLNVAIKKFKYDMVIDRDLVQFAAIAHDLGHPPFGHNGEHALEELMREHGGFEGNAQTLRILSCVEEKFVESGADFTSKYGLDLTYRALASVLKYDKVIPHRKENGDGLAKGYYGCEQELVNEIKLNVAPGFSGSDFKTLECWIMDIADDIAYSTYDLEDSLHAGFVSPLSLLNSLFNDEKIKNAVIEKTNEALTKSRYDVLGVNELWAVAANLLKPPQNGAGIIPTGDAIIDAAMQSVSVNVADRSFSTSNLLRTQFTAERVGNLVSELELHLNEKFPALSVVKLTRDALIQVEIFKHLNYELVIRSPKLAIVQYRGKDIVTKIFSAIIESKGAFLSGRWKTAYDEAADSGKYRVVCDYVAGMTDRYAVEFYDALFGEGKSLYGPA